MQALKKVVLDNRLDAAGRIVTHKSRCLDEAWLALDTRCTGSSNIETNFLLVSGYRKSPLSIAAINGYHGLLAKFRVSRF